MLRACQRFIHISHCFYYEFMSNARAEIVDHALVTSLLPLAPQMTPEAPGHLRINRATMAAWRV